MQRSKADLDPSIGGSSVGEAPSSEAFLVSPVLYNINAQTVGAGNTGPTPFEEYGAAALLAADLAAGTLMLHGRPEPARSMSDPDLDRQDTCR